MEILINHQLATLKEGTSFDFVAENRYFSGADSYTLAITFPLKGCPGNLITFPLKGCPGNLAIFGHINRKDVVAQQILFDCEIRHGAFYRHGSITITEISDIEVKTQFLEGRSVQNYSDSFETIYINELNLGYPDTSTSSFSPKAHLTCKIARMIAHRGPHRGTMIRVDCRSSRISFICLSRSATLSGIRTIFQN